MASEMTLLTRHEIERALRRLGEVAASEGHQLEVLLVGGAAMVLGYDARSSTHDVDGVFTEPPPAATIRRWIDSVADEFGWPADWFNDAAKGYLVGQSRGRQLLSAPGINAWQPLPEQLLAMKLAAWRDSQDIADARLVLQELLSIGDRQVIWKKVEPFLMPGRELKSQLAFSDLWKSLHDSVE